MNRKHNDADKLAMIYESASQKNILIERIISIYKKNPHLYKEGFGLGGIGKMIAPLAGAAGTAIGTMYGGPAGGAIGGQLGNMVGGALGGKDSKGSTGAQSGAAGGAGGGISDMLGKALGSVTGGQPSAPTTQAGQPGSSGSSGGGFDINSIMQQLQGLKPEQLQQIFSSLQGGGAGGAQVATT